MEAKDRNYWVKSGKYAGVERISILIFGVATFYVLVRTVSKEQYGIWMLYFSMVTLLDMARHGFSRNPLIRYLGMPEMESKARLLSSSLFLNLAGTTAISLLMLLAAFPLSNLWNSPALIRLLELHLIINVFLSFFYHFEYFLKAELRFKGSAVSYVVRGSVFFLFVVYFYFAKTELSLEMLAVGFGLSILAGALVGRFYLGKLYEGSVMPTWYWVKTLGAYGKYTLATNVSAVFLRYIDTWMLGFYMSPVAVAIYNVAVRIANLFEVPSMAMASVLFPEAVRRTRDGNPEVFKSLYEKSVAVILLLSIPFVVFVMFTADHIVVLLAGDQYKGSGDILIITMIYGLIVPFNKQMGVLLDAVGLAKKNSWFVLRNAIINATLNAIAIPLMGIKGAAYATLTTFILAMILNQIYLSRKYGVRLLSVGYEMKAFTKSFWYRIFG